MIYTTLVNKENKWKESLLKKCELIKTKNIDGEDVLVEKEAYTAFMMLKDSLAKKKIIIEIDSCFRSVDEQKKLYDKYLIEEGESYVRDYVAREGYSEHHTGLAIDISIVGEQSKEEESYKVIHNILYQFGFILRYPLNKEKITGYSYEPWHIRYVGRVPALIMKRENLVLEEYLKDYGGILYINKPKGITSFDVVNKISHIFGIKRVGHTGTLDPMATGVMIVAVGRAVKIVELLTAEDKEYIAEAELGYQTDTLDIEGKIIHQKDVSTNNIEEVVHSFQKTYLQEVPLYSAVKIDGKKLYEYARSGISIDLPKREVTIKKIELLDVDHKHFKIKALVSKGCFIRSLINDIGLSLNTYATMSSLERTKQGNIGIDVTNTLEEVEKGEFKIHKIEEVLDYPSIELDSNLAKKVINGVAIPNTYSIQDKVLMFYQSKLLGIYQVKGDMLQTWKNFT